MTEKTHASLAIPARDLGDGLALPPRDVEWKRAKIALWIVLFCFALGAVRTVVVDIMHSRSIDATTRQNARQYVKSSRRRRPIAAADAFAGRCAASSSRRSFARDRLSAALVRRYRARVKQGQLLAGPRYARDRPGTRASRRAARADEFEPRAREDFARTLAAIAPARRGIAAGTRRAPEHLNQDVANLSAAEANVRRLKQLESFKRIVAPFAGVVTQRNVDVGDLIDAGSGASRALFALAQSEPLRVYVQLPQAYAQNVTSGQQVVVMQAEMPGEQFHGTITHISGAIDVPTRSLQVEVTLPNPDGRLRPGAYVQVALPSTAHARLLVPGNTLLFRSEGPRLAVVDANGVVHLHKIDDRAGPRAVARNRKRHRGQRQGHRQPQRFDRGWRSSRRRAAAPNRKQTS